MIETKHLRTNAITTIVIDEVVFLSQCLSCKNMSVNQVYLVIHQGVIKCFGYSTGKNNWLNVLAR